MMRPRKAVLISPLDARSASQQPRSLSGAHFLVTSPTSKPHTCRGHFFRALAGLATMAASVSGCSKQHTLETSPRSGRCSFSLRSSRCSCATGETSTMSGEVLNEGIEMRLYEAVQVARRRRLRTLSLTLGLGSSCLIGGLLLTSIFVAVTVDPIMSSVGMFIAVHGLYLMLLSVMPTDRRAIQGICIFLAIAAFAIFVYFTTVVATEWHPCISHVEVDNEHSTSYNCITLAVNTIDCLICACACVGASSCCRVSRMESGSWRMVLTPRAALGRLWLIMGLLAPEGISWMVSAFLLLFFASNRRSDDIRDVFSRTIGAVSLLSVATISHSNCRAYLQRLLSGMGQEAESANTAASIAATIGSIPVQNALKDALESFKSIPSNLITEADLASSAPAPSLSALAQHAPLGKVDYFLSHSWSDSAKNKWEALKRLEDRFREKHARAPTIWLDKACLNQSNIQESLAHLPVHMAGCRSLLIIAGSTYNSRIWTLLEIFVWHAMGKDLKRIYVIPIADDDTEDAPQANKAVYATFAQVDVAKARCRNERDKEKILAIIEANFGRLGPFNRLVQSVLVTPASSVLTRKSPTKESHTADYDVDDVTFFV